MLFIIRENTVVSRDRVRYFKVIFLGRSRELTGDWEVTNPPL